MSQPFNATAQVPCLRDQDTDRGEFWVSSPWNFPASGENLSAYERNGVFLNDRQGGFHDVSYVSGADSPGDGRSAVSWDITGDGMPELFVRQAGGGSLLVFRNRFPPAHWLKLSLRGTRSNRFGIGAKVECEAGKNVIRRSLYPVVNFLSQAPAMIHLGLADATRIKRLKVRWPSGTTQEWTDLPVDRHLLLREDRAGFETVPAGDEAAGR